MQYAIDSESRIIAVHDDGQNLTGLYPNLNIVHSEQVFELDSILPPEAIADRSDFDAACARFREICGEIGKLAGNPEFKGGFDEMTAFQESVAFATTEGIRLSLAWNAANELCKYEGAKIGLGQPAWWRECWNG